MKKVLSSTEKTENIESLTKEAVSIIDKASKKGIIHSNKAARYKSRIMKK